MSRAGILCLALGIVTLAAQQGFAPDELTSRSGPYVPPPPPNTLRTQVNLVEVPVVVRDGKHRAVASLRQGDFEIFDAGRKQTITAFSVETFTPPVDASAPKPPAAKSAGRPPAAPVNPEHPPRYVVLFLDDLNTPWADLKRIKLAARHFVQNRLAPGDQVAILTTAVSETTAFSSDVPSLVDGIEKVTPHQHYADGQSSPCPRITGYQAYLIANHMDNETLQGVVAEDMACKGLLYGPALQDVNALAPVIWEEAKANSAQTLYSIGNLVDSLGKIPGRRMILLASAGFLSRQLEYQEDELIARAIHAGVIINSLDAKGLYTYDPGGRPINAPSRGSVRTQTAEMAIQGMQAMAKDDSMASLALGTGGSFYHNSNDLDRGFHELASLPEVVYVLGFSPADIAPDGRFHTLKVKLATGSHYSLQARMGYTAPTKAPPSEPGAVPRLDQEVTAADTLSGVPAKVTTRPGNPVSGTPTLTVTVNLDVSHLRFETRGDRRVQKLTFIAALLDAAGNLIAGRQGEVDLALKQATFDRLADSGLNVALPLHAPPGSYTLRAVVQEGLDAKMTAVSQAVELR